MPRISRWFVRTSLIYLALGSTFGALLLADKGVSVWPLIWLALPWHMEFLLLGWMVQLAMGVAFWILPRFSSGPPRGNEFWIWLAYVCLNTGIAMIILQTWMRTEWLPVAGRFLEAAAVLLFVIGNWRRVKPFGADV